MTGIISLNEAKNSSNFDSDNNEDESDYAEFMSKNMMKIFSHKRVRDKNEQRPSLTKVALFDQKRK